MSDPQPFNLADLIVRNSYSYAGVVVHPDEADDDPTLLTIEVDDLMDAIPAGLVVEALKQALAFAIPAAIREEFTRNRCDTCDTPFLRCVEKLFDDASARCCAECSHKDMRIGSQRVNPSVALLMAAATGAPTLADAIEYMEADSRGEVVSVGSKPGDEEAING